RASTHQLLPQPLDSYKEEVRAVNEKPREQRSREVFTPRLEWRKRFTAALVADAPGRALSAGIPGAAEKSRKLSRSLLYARAGGRSDASASAALRHGRGDPVLRYPGGASGPGPQGKFPRRRRPIARAVGQGKR